MKVEDVIKNIDQIKRCVVGSCDEFCKYYDYNEYCCKWDLETQHNSLNMAIEALKKQIPKKLTHLTECANEGYYCPSCSKRLFKKEMTNKHKCCYNCGQKIDYSGCNEY